LDESSWISVSIWFDRGALLIGNSQSWSSATFTIDVPFMTKLLDIYIAEINAIKHVTGLLPSLIMQIITREEIMAFQRNGGNALGIADNNKPLLRKSPSYIFLRLAHFPESNL
jgi:hypothetical protein